MGIISVPNLSRPGVSIKPERWSGKRPDQPLWVIDRRRRQRFDCYGNPFADESFGGAPGGREREDEVWSDGDHRRPVGGDAEVPYEGCSSSDGAETDAGGVSSSRSGGDGFVNNRGCDGWTRRGMCSRAGSRFVRVRHVCPPPSEEMSCKRRTVRPAFPVRDPILLLSCRRLSIGGRHDRRSRSTPHLCSLRQLLAPRRSTIPLLERPKSRGASARQLVAERMQGRESTTIRSIWSVMAFFRRNHQITVFRRTEVRASGRTRASRRLSGFRCISGGNRSNLWVSRPGFLGHQGI